MRAIEYDHFGGYDVLDLVEAPRPTTADGQVLVRMMLAGVSPLDETVRAGHLAPVLHKPLPIRPGGTGTGVVEEPGASGLPRGARVAVSGGRYGVGADGCWAEYVAVDPANLVVVPDTVDDEAAAALTTGAGHLTAYLALTALAAFRPGQAVLAPGVGGAVGQGGVEVAGVLGAAHAITTATGTDQAEQGRAAGYEVIDLSRESLRDGVTRLTGGRGVDVVLDGVGGQLTGQALGCLAVDGTLVSIGYAAGILAATDVIDLIGRNAHLHGFRFAAFTPEQVNAANTTLLARLAAGDLHPSVAQVFRLAQAAAAQHLLAECQPFGRVLLAV
ncbi:quinone oxidoreductase family protein [Catellatospora sichuanensis]|uniref:quinone oxidoreductase family protein n=1 Tax=Catellatospora sichuanensis TaxID=1969805 RepID=UPI001184627B|nr:zinc-binding alcohol dehydrogenase family protein [Catellatospora sichuanensis]